MVTTSSNKICQLDRRFEAEEQKISKYVFLFKLTDFFIKYFNKWVYRMIFQGKKKLDAVSVEGIHETFKWFLKTQTSWYTLQCFRCPFSCASMFRRMPSLFLAQCAKLNLNNRNSASYLHAGGFMLHCAVVNCKPVFLHTKYNTNVVIECLTEWEKDHW